MSRRKSKRKSLKSDDSRDFCRFLGRNSSKSALAELRCTTCCLQTVLLSLLHSGVAGQETGILQSGAILGIHSQQCAGDTVTDSAGLAGNTAACDGNNNVNLTDHVGGNQGLTDNQLQGIQTKIIVDVAAIDDDRTCAVLVDANTCNRGLTAAGAIVILLLALVHNCLPPNQSRVQASGFWAA